MRAPGDMADESRPLSGTFSICFLIVFLRRPRSSPGSRQLHLFASAEMLARLLANRFSRPERYLFKRRACRIAGSFAFHQLRRFITRPNPTERAERRWSRAAI